MTMRKCTDPERWKVIPGSDAPESEVEAYLSHVRECVFHAKIEKRHQEMLKTITEIARSKAMDGHPLLPMEEIARIRENTNRRGERDPSKPIQAALQRMNLGWAFKLALTLLIGTVIAFLVTTQLLITEQPKQIAQQGERQQQIEK